jgi:hypothetical protein
MIHLVPSSIIVTHLTCLLVLHPMFNFAELGTIPLESTTAKESREDISYSAGSWRRTYPYDNRCAPLQISEMIDISVLNTQPPYTCVQYMYTAIAPMRMMYIFRFTTRVFKFPNTNACWLRQSTQKRSVSYLHRYPAFESQADGHGCLPQQLDFDMMHKQDS